MQPSPLDALHDVLPPPEVSWWPLSYAAWGVIASSIVIIALLIWWAIKHHQHNFAKRDALQLAKNEHDPLVLHTILKRLTKHYYGTEFASVRQDIWLKVIVRLSKQTLTANELSSLYSPTPADGLVPKLQLAIRQFKTSERKLVEVFDV